VPVARQILDLGGLRLRFDGCDPAGLPGAYASFTSGGSRCDARFSVEVATALAEPGPLLCDGKIWRLFARGDGLRLELYTPPRSGYRPLMQADLSADWTRGVLRFDPELAPPEAIAAPMATPFGEMLLIALMSQGRGLYVHGAAAFWPQGVDLMLGRSGAGKTTISGICERQGAQILSDDRTLLRMRHGRLWAFGTPFHGTGRRWTARAAPVRALFFLEKGPAAVWRRLELPAATARLVSVSFTQSWSRGAVETTLRACEEACSQVLSFELSFRPDATAVAAIDGASRSMMC
jgi:hypothetical protein